MFTAKLKKLTVEFFSGLRTILINHFVQNCPFSQSKLHAVKKILTNIIVGKRILLRIK